MKMTVKTGAKALLMGALAAGICLGMTAGAFAQDEEEEVEELAPRPVRVRVVGAYLSDNSVKDFLGAPILGLGASYDFKQTESRIPVHIAATIDFMNKTRTRDRRKVEAAYFAIGVAPRIYFKPEESKLNFYAGAGVLVSFPRYKVTIAGTEQSQDNTISVGAKFFSGMEFDRSFFGEIEYILPGKTELNSLNFALGYRF
jgi:hypothetical protein